MTTGIFSYIDPATYSPDKKPWGKVDYPVTSYQKLPKSRSVHNLRGQESEFSTDNAGFSLHTWPSKERSFTDDAAVRGPYYAEVEALVKAKLPGVKKVVIFDHTIRRRTKDSPRQPVQLVHVDQTAEATRKRVFRHLPKDEAKDLLAHHRYQIVNVWRPIENPATDFPLAVIDWRSTAPQDFVPVDLLYPVRQEGEDDDDRGKERLPDPSSLESAEGYEPRGETIAIAPNENHRFYYVKDMRPDEALFLKCFDSQGQGQDGGKDGIAVGTPHTAFADPETPSDAPGRQSIEVRCLVFYE
jgi:hypothetical protein